MTPLIIDAHRHQFKPNEQRADISLVNAIRLSEWDLYSLTDSKSTIFRGIGVHPWVVEEYRSHIEQQLLTDQTVAKAREVGAKFIGEIGIDTTRPQLELQRLGFAMQLEAAQQLTLPCVIHCVRAHAETRQTLQGYQLSQVFVHSFDSSLNELLAWNSLGAFLSLRPSMLFRSPAKACELLWQVPPDKLMLESDAPDSAYSIFQVHEQVACLLETSVTQLAERHALNVSQFLSCKVPDSSC